MRRQEMKVRQEEVERRRMPARESACIPYCCIAFNARLQGSQESTGINASRCNVSALMTAPKQVLYNPLVTLFLREFTIS
jgi:hypothetical protein